MSKSNLFVHMNDPFYRPLNLESGGSTSGQLHPKFSNFAEAWSKEK